MFNIFKLFHKKNNKSESPAKVSDHVEIPTDVSNHVEIAAGVSDRVKVASGEFLMGSTINHVREFFFNSGGVSNPNQFDCERPQRKVFLDAYEIDKYPVTCKKYSTFCRETGHAAPAYWKSACPPDELINHPVVEVTLMDAMKYAAWAGGRLPYETEWEKAARGEDGRIYPWGNEFDPALTNSDKQGDDAKTQPVDAYPGGASPYGCLDMIGNVHEWTLDVITPYPGYEPNVWWDEAAEPLKIITSQLNPTFWPNTSTVRGGSYKTLKGFCRCASRLPVDASCSMPEIGFRCVYAPDPNKIAIQFLNQRKFGEAIPYIEKAIQISPVHAGILFNAAMCYQGNQQYDRAIELWETLLKNWPDDADARNLHQICKNAQNQPLWVYNRSKDLYQCAKCGYLGYQMGDAFYPDCRDLKKCPGCGAAQKSN